MDGEWRGHRVRRAQYGDGQSQLVWWTSRVKLLDHLPLPPKKIHPPPVPPRVQEGAPRVCLHLSIWRSCVLVGPKP